MRSASHIAAHAGLKSTHHYMLPVALEPLSKPQEVPVSREEDECLDLYSLVEGIHHVDGHLNVRAVLPRAPLRRTSQLGSHENRLASVAVQRGLDVLKHR